MNDVDMTKEALRRNAPTPLGQLTLQRETAGAKLALTVSPASWMYKDYPLQVKISLAGGGSASLADRTKRFETATEADLQGMLDSVRLTPCCKCGQPAFDPATVETNRGGQCEACFIDELDQTFAAEQKKEAKKVVRRDARQKKLGMTHRVTAWIHPKAGGDDYQVDIYAKGEPTKAEIQSLLRKQGSAVLTDYQIVNL